MNRDRAYYRKQRARAINRKQGICKRVGGDDSVRAWTRGQPGRLSKSKIHCSCWMCRIKSDDCKSASDISKDLSAQDMLRDYRAQGLN